jgi:uncharacterized membrane protein YeaQ/YmgE (transglycosylase-associated protein family)
MSDTIVDLIILLVAGVIGGNAIAKALPKHDLGAMGNTVAGAIGGLGGGLIIQTVILTLMSGGLEFLLMVQLIGGIISGAILTVVVSNWKSRTTKE